MTSSSSTSFSIHFDHSKSETCNTSIKYNDGSSSKHQVWSTTTTVVNTLPYRPNLTLSLTRPSTKRTPLLPLSTLDAYPYQQLDWYSLTVVYFVIFITEGARGIIMPTAWPYFHSLGGTKTSLGLFIACHSFGRLVSTVPAGLLTDHFTLLPLFIIACTLQVAGHLLYIIAPSLAALYVSRIVVGIGAAATFFGVVHITKAVPAHQRMQQFAFNAGIQFSGIYVMPGIGGVLSSLPTLDIPLICIRLNSVTYPAFILAFANIAAILLLYRYYSAPKSLTSSSSLTPSTISAIAFTSQTTGQKVSSISTSSQMVGNNYQTISIPAGRHPNIYALATCMFINLFLRGAMATLETLGIPILHDKFQLSTPVASLYLSAIGIFGVVIYFLIPFLPRRFPDRSLILLGFTLIIVGVLPLSFPPLSKLLSLPSYLSFLSFALSVGMPLSATATVVLFTKLLNGVSVGMYFAIFALFGTISPIVCGIFTASLWNACGTDFVFLAVVFMAISVYLLTIFNYDRLRTSVDIWKKQCTVGSGMMRWVEKRDHLDCHNKARVAFGLSDSVCFMLCSVLVYTCSRIHRRIGLSIVLEVFNIWSLFHLLWKTVSDNCKHYVWHTNSE